MNTVFGYRWSPFTIALVCVFAFAGAPSFAAIQPVSPKLTPMITFDEIAPLTNNPVYTLGGTTVSFGSLFEGQMLGTNPNSLEDSTPSAPLALSTSGPLAMTMVDLGNPTLLVLGSSGNGTAFTAPLAMLFADPVNWVEFDLGVLDPQGGTANIELYDDQGNTIGTYANTHGGIERIALADDTFNNVIAGVSVFVGPGPDDMDWEGFAVDSVAFGFDSPDAHAPEPAAIAIWAVLGLIAAPILARRKKQ